MISFWRATQTITLLLFLLCLAATAMPVPEWLPAREVFHLDPVLVACTLAAQKAVVPGLILAGLILALTFFLGRFFCAYICPLGTTIDAARPLVRSARTEAALPNAKLRRLKYLLLLLLFLAAALGWNIVHFGSPLSLAGRFYVLVAGPLLHFLIKPLLQLIESFPLPLQLDLPLAGEPVSRYQALFFFIPLFLLIFGLSRLTPRFWCRYLCPAGGLFGLVGGRPVFRRRVSDDCIDCGLCQQRCPMQAIATDDPRRTWSSECIVCQRCLHLCPVRAISFSARGRPKPVPAHLPGRRAVLQTAALTGLTFAIGRLGLQEYWPNGSQGHLMSASLIRPPGAVPEGDFLNRCVRCGLCLTVCPTNMLQPAWLETGFTGLSAPLAVPRRGPCEPECAACGQVCPTGAIRALPLQEKSWAKMGTATIRANLCLAWEFGRSCLVCDEACPYGAIELKRLPEQEAAVPFVDEDACTGCGFCEHACPVQGRPAIAVTPMGALRLARGSHREEARRLGLRLGRNEGKEQADQDSGQGRNGGGGELPPGFSPE